MSTEAQALGIVKGLKPTPLLPTTLWPPPPPPHKLIHTSARGKVVLALSQPHDHNTSRWLLMKWGLGDAQKREGSASILFLVVSEA